MATPDRSTCCCPHPSCFVKKCNVSSAACSIAPAAKTGTDCKEPNQRKVTWCIRPKKHKAPGRAGKPAQRGVNISGRMGRNRNGSSHQCQRAETIIIIRAACFIAKIDLISEQARTKIEEPEGGARSEHGLTVVKLNKNKGSTVCITLRT